MIVACGTLSYRQQPLQRALEGIARAGFRWVEIGCVSGYCEHIIPEAMDAADADRLADQVSRAGLRIASIAGHIDLKYPLLGRGPETARDGFFRLRKRIDLACRLGVSIVNTGVGAAQDNSELEPFYREFDALLQYALERGVKIGLETHEGLTATAPLCLALCRRMNRPSLGVNYDAGNVRFYTGLDPVADLGGCADELRPWLIHFHVKDHRGPKGQWDFPPLGEGEVDLPAIIGILTRIGYQGPCSLEIEFSGVGTDDPSPEIIDRGVLQSYRFMKDLGLQDS